jgi:hypothetical protein
MTVFLRAIEADAGDKPLVLRSLIASIGAAAAIGDGALGASPQAFVANASDFSRVPGTPFAYWVSAAVRSTFSEFEPMEGGPRSLKQGLATADDFRFLRLWTEVSEASLGTRWFPFAKGGARSAFYSDLSLLVGYSPADQVGLQAIGRYGRGATSYFHPGLTWPLRTDGLSFRVLPAGCIFGHKGPSAFVADDDSEALLSQCALMNSLAFGYLVAVQLARTELAQSYEVGLIQQTPVPKLTPLATARLASLAHRAWSLKRAMDGVREASHAFVLPSARRHEATSAPPPQAGADCGGVAAELAAIQHQIDGVAFELYRMGREDRLSIEMAARRPLSSNSEGEEAGDQPDEEGEIVAPASLSPLSYLLGIAFGRFDPRLATGERPIPPEPEPFDPLPARSPGMWPADEPYPTPPPALLVDDPHHPLDLVAHVATAAARAQFPEPESPRAWYAREFFPLHIKQYSKSRRKAPIYWQLATPSATYSVWLYLHALNPNTLYEAADLAREKLGNEQRKLASKQAEQSPGAAARKELAAQETFVNELAGLLADLEIVKPLWKPHLDDGVVINAAPLWRLFPQHKGWQKDLAPIWASLQAGEYDWSHMAMHLWPERVVPKCAQDRSLAIAHGLEEVFWVEDEKGKWQKRGEPTVPGGVEELVKERASVAVKEALGKLIEAGAGSAAKPRGKRAKA